jgi:Zn-dependent peptidase ImmA (M78 family)
LRNIQLKARTAADIDSQVAKILRGLGMPEPPIDLRLVRELLKLDRAYYSTADDSALRETVNKLTVAGLQVLKRPTLLLDAVRLLSLKALYLPDQKRILLDQDLPPLKPRWNEAHEVGHDIIPWHAGMIMGDSEKELTPSCHAQMEAEANYAAGQILFMAGRFIEEAGASAPTLAMVRELNGRFGNTITSTLWRYVEQVRPDLPMVGLVTGHPHQSRRKAEFNPAEPCRYCVQSPSFIHRFGAVTEIDLFRHIASYCGAQRGGRLGEAEILLMDTAQTRHLFHFETFFNSYEALTLSVWVRQAPTTFNH